MTYKLFKICHVAALVTWLGPSTGGYYLLFLSHIHNLPDIEMWLRMKYLTLIHIETAGLLLLIVSGLGMLLASKWLLLKQGWLRIKLFFVIFAFVSLEVLQLYIYHKLIKKAFITGVGIEKAVLIYDRFSLVAFIVLVLTVPTVFWLAIFKPDIRLFSKK